MRVKICGIRNHEDAKTAIKAGASAIGFLVGITHLAEDKINPDMAKDIILKTPPFISTVMVTHLTDKNEIISLVNFLGVSTLQIHEYISVDDITWIKNKIPHVKCIKTIHVIDMKSTLNYLEMFESVADAILLDTKTTMRIGGTGIVHDWNISSKIVEKSCKPVILAGGIKPENAYEAVRIVQPFAIDLNSGAEINGYKDYNRIRTIVQQATLAE